MKPEHGYSLSKKSIVAGILTTTLIPTETYDYISIEPELNGVNVYDGQDYPTDLISFSELGLSIDNKSKTLK